MTRMVGAVGIWSVVGLVALGLVASSTGCGVDGYSRNAEITHWHDQETFIVVYTRERTLGNVTALFRPVGETVHVRICTIEDDNAVTCRHERRLTNMLNPETVDDGDLHDDWLP